MSTHLISRSSSSSSRSPSDEGDREEEEDFFEDDEDLGDLFEAPPSILEAFKAVSIGESALPIAFELNAEVPEEDELVVVAREDDCLVEMRRLSDIAALRNSGKYFQDEEVTLEFALTVENSPYPLQTVREIVDSNSIHANHAKAVILKGVASWMILAKQIQVFEEAHGRDPPALVLTTGESLSGITGGVYNDEEEEEEE